VEAREDEGIASRLTLRIVALGITQVISWGATFNLPGILGPSMAESLGVSVDDVLLGPTVMLVTLALISWVLAPVFERFGARRVMLIGHVVAMIGLGGVALSESMIAFLASWFVLGIAGSAILTTAAQIALAEIAGPKARQAIGMMALISGLSTTLFWPMADGLEGAFGWRGTVGVLVAFFAIICMPLTALAIPPRQQPAVTAGDPATPTIIPPLNRVHFALMAIAIAANGFITWGFSLTLILLFEQKGIGHSSAVAMASALGIVQLGARVVDFVGGRRLSGMTTGLAASLVLPMSFLLLWLGSGRTTVLLFVLMYGAAGGTMAVARSTIPLAIFPRVAYARASARLALPLNLAYAAGPPAFGAILTNWGAQDALRIAMALSTVAFISLGTLMLWVRMERERDGKVTSAGITGND